MFFRQLIDSGKVLGTGKVLFHHLEPGRKEKVHEQNCIMQSLPWFFNEFCVAKMGFGNVFVISLTCFRFVG